MNDTIKEMREPVGGRRPRRSFMHHKEFKDIRTKVIRVTQQKLSEQFIDPNTGMPISRWQLISWENGSRPIPLWAARHALVLAQAAREHDMREGT